MRGRVPRPRPRPRPALPARVDPLRGCGLPPGPRTRRLLLVILVLGVLGLLVAARLRHLLVQVVIDRLEPEVEAGLGPALPGAQRGEGGGVEAPEEGKALLRTLELQLSVIEQQFKLGRVEILTISSWQIFNSYSVDLLQTHSRTRSDVTHITAIISPPPNLPVVVEPVGDALDLEAELLGEEVRGLGAGVGVQEEGQVERLALLLGDARPRLLGAAARARLGGRVAVLV